MDITKLTALEIAEKIQQRTITPTDAVMAVATAKKEKDERYNCYASFDVDDALKAAEDVEKRLASGEKLSPLAGVPIAVKDNICEKGKPSTCASKMLEGFAPPYDATVIKRLKSAGVIPLGRTNMDEFAMGSTTENSAFGITKNPWNTDCVAGGSSGGSAAAVAADEGIIALGTDTGGSVRQPCAFCGVTGLKPTYGAVSRYGLIAFASSLDTVGVIGKNVPDAAALFDIIRGKDERDMTSAVTSDFNLQSDISGKKIGVVKELAALLPNDINNCIENAKAQLEKLGAQVHEISLPVLKYAVPAYYIIACAEASSNLARYDGVKYGYRSANVKTLDELYVNSRSEGFGEEVKKRIMLGSFVLSAGYFDEYYLKAQRVRTLVSDAFKSALASCDFLLLPTSAGTAYKIGEYQSDALRIYRDDIFTAPVNLAGLPSLALPCGFYKNMPVGMQLVGRAFDEKTILSAGAAFQSVTDFHKRRAGDSK